jgi:hypothetical protein
MDLNDYTLMLLVQDRYTEMVLAARRVALLREATRPRRPFRATLGTALLRLDAWLRYAMKSSDNAGSLWSIRTIVSFLNSKE